MANNGADVKHNQGADVTNASATTNTAENTVGTATPKQNGLAVLGKYVGVSATQTIVEYATFAILHLIGVPSQIANGIAVVCSATYNFVMNRNVTLVVPEKLRTLDRGRPWRDSQFASTRLSPSRDMSR